MASIKKVELIPSTSPVAEMSPMLVLFRVRCVMSDDAVFEFDAMSLRLETQAMNASGPWQDQGAFGGTKLEIAGSAETYTPKRG